MNAEPGEHHDLRNERDPVTDQDVHAGFNQRAESCLFHFFLSFRAEAQLCHAADVTPLILVLNPESNFKHNNRRSYATDLWRNAPRSSKHSKVMTRNNSSSRNNWRTVVSSHSTTKQSDAE